MEHNSLPFFPRMFKYIYGPIRYFCQFLPLSATKLTLIKNAPGTAGGPGGRDRTLSVKSRKNVRKITFLKDIPSSYAKILGETNFQSWEFLRSG